MWKRRTLSRLGKGLGEMITSEGEGLSEGGMGGIRKGKTTDCASRHSASFSARTRALYLASSPEAGERLEISQGRSLLPALDCRHCRRHPYIFYTPSISPIPPTFFLPRSLPPSFHSPSLLFAFRPYLVRELVHAAEKENVGHGQGTQIKDG